MKTAVNTPVAMTRWRSVRGRQLLAKLLQGDREAMRTLMSLDVPRWEPAWLQWVLRRNRNVRQEPERRQRAIADSLASELDVLRTRQSHRRTTVATDQSAFRGNRRHLSLLTRSIGIPDGANEWNTWRRTRAGRRPNLRGANLSGLDLDDLNLRRVVLRAADLSRSNLAGSDLTFSDLREIQGFETNLSSAVLKECNLRGAWLHHANFADADLSSARFGGALLTDCSLNRAGLEGADLRGVYMWGCSYWGVTLDDTTQQSDIRITSDFDWIEFAMTSESRRQVRAKADFDIRIDDLRVADFMWQIRDYPERVADMINAATGKLVLLLGRFTGPQRQILDAVLSPALARRGYIPMVFDFRPPANRDVIESVAILAGLSRFVIADLTEAQSTPLESQLLAPMLAIPFFPLVRRGHRVFSMFTDLQHKYPWVQPPQTYRGRKHLVELLNTTIIPAAEMEAKKWNRRKRVRAR